IQNNVDESFFVTNKIVTDCADVAYSLRWIFSRINGLPAANLLMGSGKMFSVFDVRDEWRKLPTSSDWATDKRFRAALVYVLRNTFTHTLLKDSYPVKLDLEGISPGSHHLHLSGSSGHTQVIYRGPSETNGLPFMMLSSTLPAEVRQLMVHFFWGDQPKNPKIEGFVRVRWAQGTSRENVKILRSEDHPWFSNEQYTPIGADGQFFPLALIKKLDPGFEITRVVQKILGDLEMLINERVHIVDDGFDYCSKNSCEPGSGGYESWSTPSRDGRLIKQINDSQLIMGLCQTCQPILEDFRKKTVVLEGHEVLLRALLTSLVFGFAPPDPRLSPLQRWGLDMTTLAQDLGKKTAAIIAERTKLVVAAKESFTLDANLNQDFGLVERYGRKLPQDLRSSLQAAFDGEQVMIEGHPVSLGDLQDNIVFWASGAAASRHERWLTKEESPFRLVPFDLGSIEVFDDASAWLTSSKRLYDLRKASFMDAPNGATWVAFSDDGSRGVVEKDNR
ncbi:MAG: hypothetical protein ABIR96_02620, partial [Bdellovibrionota bacterium]